MLKIKTAKHAQTDAKEQQHTQANEHSHTTGKGEFVHTSTHTHSLTHALTHLGQVPFSREGDEAHSRYSLIQNLPEHKELFTSNQENAQRKKKRTGEKEKTRERERRRTK